MAFSHGNGHVPEHLLREQKLWSSSSEREKYDNLANLYSILVSLEHLEKAYVRDSIPESDYTNTCKKLLARFKACLNVVPAEAASDIDHFCSTYRLECPAALQRVKIGVPATTEYGGSSDADHRKRTKHVMAATEHFISITDSFSMNIGEVDKLHADISGLMDQLNKLDNLPPDHVSKTKTKYWLEKINGMRASDSLSEDEIRQALMDFDTAYDAYKRQIYDD
eukprot:TRINITY_DN5986_c0_g1_i4.p1 TRINITY_DN5986_c0_g1~~TRINITY_DN5986_c0_g1_i4.p1  ORF type:complete len:223 (+),score=35.07 TRINITY_DN5986_c0_g1_i4:52-720(+)